jgi:hypothetical protein
MNRKAPIAFIGMVVLAVFLFHDLRWVNSSDDAARTEDLKDFDVAISKNATNLIRQGRRIFRFDTFGDEVFWGDTLRLHEALAKVSPKEALALGLKVDVDALPQSLVNALKRGEVNLNDPSVTADLLKLNAVVGVTGFFSSNNLTSVGIQCSFCHSTVNDSLTAGIGRRLDGWANRDLNVGRIVALAPNLQPIADLLGVDVPTVRQVLRSWGPGKFDAQLLLDGKAFQPDGNAAATLIPPAFGLAGVNNHTWTGSWGTVTYWNAFVANIEMRGQGTFFDPRLNNKKQFPVAAKAGFANIRHEQDLVTSKLPALHFYQLSIPAPQPPAGSFDAAAAERGDEIFSNKARCSTCHVKPLFTEPGWNLHTAERIGIDSFQAKRSPDRRYRTAPLKGLWTHQKGGFYHDGRFQTLLDVINHYNNHFNLALSDQEKNDIVEYLKSL